MNVDAWELKSFEDAMAAAARQDVPTLAVDRGPGVFPRYDVTPAPQVGDYVSEGYNGDSYYIGQVEKIGKDYKRVKAAGVWFYRHKLTATWRRANSCYSLLLGVHNTWNPEF